MLVMTSVKRWGILTSSTHSMGEQAMDNKDKELFCPFCGACGIKYQRETLFKVEERVECFICEYDVSLETWNNRVRTEKPNGIR
jgi:hypothetical protein